MYRKLCVSTKRRNVPLFHAHGSVSGWRRVEGYSVSQSVTHQDITSSQSMLRRGRVCDLLVPNSNHPHTTTVCIYLTLSWGRFHWDARLWRDVELHSLRTNLVIVIHDNALLFRLHCPFSPQKVSGVIEIFFVTYCFVKMQICANWLCCFGVTNLIIFLSNDLIVSNSN